MINLLILFSINHVNIYLFSISLAIDWKVWVNPHCLHRDSLTLIWNVQFSHMCCHWKKSIKGLFDKSFIQIGYYYADITNKKDRVKLKKKKAIKKHTNFVYKKFTNNRLIGVYERYKCFKTNDIILFVTEVKWH